MNIIHMDLRLNEGGMGRTGKKDGSDAVKCGREVRNYLKEAEEPGRARWLKLRLRSRAS